MPRRRRHVPANPASLAGAVLGFACIATALLVLALGLAGRIGGWLAVVVGIGLVAAGTVLIARHVRRHPRAAVE